MLASHAAALGPSQGHQLTGYPVIWSEDGSPGNKKELGTYGSKPTAGLRAAAYDHTVPGARLSLE